MADFALWATACEAALCPAVTFWSEYCANRAEAVEAVIDATRLPPPCAPSHNRAVASLEAVSIRCTSGLNAALTT